MSWTEKLDHVHPELKKRVFQVVASLAAVQGYDFRVVQGLRTADEQNALYAQGRTKPGKIVTKAKAWQSNHNYGLAVDMCPFKDGQPDWNDTKAFQALGEAAKRFGLHWGGDWKTIKDMPHLELGDLSVKECLALYNKGGLSAVWAKVGGKSEVQSTESTVSSSKPTLLKLGSKGAEVRAMQDKLVSLMYMRKADGIFGPHTEAAVKAFQRDNSLTVDGKAGLDTLTTLHKVYDQRKK